MKIIDRTLLDETSLRARSSVRGRMNHNFHHHLEDPFHRLLNALEPGTFLPAHRHRDKDEGIVLLRGRVASFIFDEEGSIIQQTVVDPREKVYGFDIPAGEWHGLLVLESGTVLYETKAGPYRPLEPDEIAFWSPAPDDRPAIEAYLSRLAEALEDL